MVALEVHRGAILALDPNLDARRLGEVIDSTIGDTRERLHGGPVGQHIGRHVDFVPGGIDKRNVNMFEVFRRCIVNDRRRMVPGK